MVAGDFNISLLVIDRVSRQKKKSVWRISKHHYWFNWHFPTTILQNSIFSRGHGIFTKINHKISLSKFQKNITLNTKKLTTEIKKTQKRLLQEDGTERKQYIGWRVTQYVGQMEKRVIPIRWEFGDELVIDT